MNKVYNFSWLVNEIDDTYILELVQNEKLIGVYSVERILTNGLDDINIRFANIDDLTKFISHAIIRFTQITNNNNVLDIPVRNLYMLNNYGNELGKSDKSITVESLDAYGTYQDQILSNKLSVVIHKITEESDELLEIMEITKEFNNLSMNEKINTLEKLNLLNYHMSVNN